VLELTEENLVQFEPSFDLQRYSIIEVEAKTISDVRGSIVTVHYKNTAILLNKSRAYYMTKKGTTIHRELLKENMSNRLRSDYYEVVDDELCSIKESTENVENLLKIQTWIRTFSSPTFEIMLSEEDQKALETKIPTPKTASQWALALRCIPTFPYWHCVIFVATVDPW
jgi:hypothetical protein